MEAQRDDERCTIRNQYSCLFDRRREDPREANSLKSKHGRLEDINKKSNRLRSGKEVEVEIQTVKSRLGFHF